MVNVFLKKIDKIDLSDTVSANYVSEMLHTSTSYLEEVIKISNKQVSMNLIYDLEVDDVKVWNLVYAISINDENYVAVPGLLLSANPSHRNFLEDIIKNYESDKKEIGMLFAALGYDVDPRTEEFDPAKNIVHISDNTGFLFTITEEIYLSAKEILSASDKTFSSIEEEFKFIEENKLPYGDNLFLRFNNVVEEAK